MQPERVLAIDAVTAAVKQAMPAYRACACTVRDRARALMLESHALLVPTLELEQKGALTGKNQEGTAFVTARLAASAATVRDMVIDAWRASVDMGVGYPMIVLRDIESGTRILTRDDFGRD
mgnify:CR=1 FL=1